MANLSYYAKTAEWTSTYLLTSRGNVNDILHCEKCLLSVSHAISAACWQTSATLIEIGRKFNQWNVKRHSIGSVFWLLSSLPAEHMRANNYFGLLEAAARKVTHAVAQFPNLILYSSLRDFNAFQSVLVLNYSSEQILPEFNIETFHQSLTAFDWRTKNDYTGKKCLQTENKYQSKGRQRLLWQLYVVTLDFYQTRCE